MKIEGAHRVGRLERTERFLQKARGAAKHDENPMLSAATVAVLGVLVEWLPEVDTWRDSEVIRLEKDIEGALESFIPAEDGRRANGRRPGGGAL